MAYTECGAYREKRVAANNRKNGFIQKGFLVIIALFLFSAGNYLFSVNQNAVHGYRIRALEKEITVLKKESSQLRVSEAEARSLERMKDAGARMGMERATDVISVEREEVVAMK